MHNTARANPRTTEHSNARLTVRYNNVNQRSNNTHIRLEHSKQRKIDIVITREIWKNGMEGYWGTQQHPAYQQMTTLAQDARVSSVTNVEVGINVVGVYIAPNKNSAEALEEIIANTVTGAKHQSICGDFNAHHTTWGGPDCRNNKRGRTLHRTADPTLINTSSKEIKKDLDAALGKTENNSAPGPDGVSYKLLKCIKKELPTFWGELRAEIANSLRNGAPWGTESKVTMFPKPGKNLPTSKGWRPIALSNILDKLTEKYVACQIQYEERTIHESAIGGRIGINFIHTLVNDCTSSSFNNVLRDTVINRLHGAKSPWTNPLSPVKHMVAMPRVLETTQTMYQDIAITAYIDDVRIRNTKGPSATTTTAEETLATELHKDRLTINPEKREVTTSGRSSNKVPRHGAQRDQPSNTYPPNKGGTFGQGK
ncbi:hypothetical protein DFH27DRAFT_630492 [Peziza echinospora]|nr:hypothetical protein DFH27DRAFT_630492 [Peziza echinospora]